MYIQGPLPFVGHHCQQFQVASSKTEGRFGSTNLLVQRYTPYCIQGIRQ